MDDLELTKRCAMAMEYFDVLEWSKATHISSPSAMAARRFPTSPFENYDPLTDDQQAMALVKRFRLAIHPPNPEGPRKYHKEWTVEHVESQMGESSTDLNRAVCMCVAAHIPARLSAPVAAEK